MIDAEPIDEEVNLDEYGIDAFVVGIQRKVSYSDINTDTNFTIRTDGATNFTLSTAGDATIRTSLTVPLIHNTTLNNTTLNGVTGTFTTLTVGTGTFTTFSATSKFFDIVHPTDSSKRLRHGCLEGPELAVYLRGTTRERVINFPQYFQDLVDPESITVHLTPIGHAQQLFVDWDSVGFIVYGGRLNSESQEVHYSYLVMGTRRDVPSLIAEYTPES